MDQKATKSSNLAKMHNDRYKRYVLDPFQIFCIHRRRDILSSKPNLKPGEITGILGRIWRNMTSENKEEYILLAKKLEDNTCHVTRKKKYIGTFDLETLLSSENFSKLIGDAQNKLDTQENMCLHTPRLFIVPRSGSNSDLSDISYALISENV